MDNIPAPAAALRTSSVSAAEPRTPAGPRILVVDDEPDIADLVVETLTAEGFDSVACHSGDAALGMLASGRFDLAILDVMMPGMDGYELCRRIRLRSDMPIIFLSARVEEADKVVGLMLGGDDYVEKPFRKRELVARVRVLLRRMEPGRVRGRAVSARGIEVDIDAHAASLHGEPLALTPKEFGVLRLLVERAGSPVSSRELYEEVWGEPFSDVAANSVMVHIRHLRKKLAEIDSSESPIETAWGVGYRIGMRAGGAQGGRG